MDLIASSLYGTIDSAKEFFECYFGTCLKSPSLVSNEKISNMFRVIFLTEEEHRNNRIIKRNVSFLNREFDTDRGDAIWVEEDEARTRDELELSQIEGFDLAKAKTIKGWDDHESIAVRETALHLVRAATDSIKRLQSVPCLDVNNGDLLLLRTIALQAEIPEWAEINDGELLGDKITDSLIPSMQKYLANLTNHVICKEFPKRQERLAAKIHTFLKESPQGVLFIFVGKAHLDLTNKITKIHVQKILESLKGHPYTIYPF